MRVTHHKQGMEFADFQTTTTQLQANSDETEWNASLKLTI